MNKAIVDFFIKWYFSLFFFLLECIALFFIIFNNPLHNLLYKGSAHFIVGSIYNFRSEIEDYFSLRKTNEKLANENAFLKGALYRINRPIREAEVQKKDDYQQYTYIPVKIISNNINSKRRNYITLNKGRVDGIKEEMGIVLENAIVGVVINVSDHFSTALSILDMKTKINARIKESNYFGFLSWDGKDPRYMILKDVPKYAQISKGQIIQTDSKSMIFPEGIPIGVIEGYSLNEESNHHFIKVKLGVDMANIREAYVVKNLFKEERKKLESSFYE